ncbi:DUF4249 domain-containing protein [Hymenobacter properus]|uniref:DUF4249 domain-containing protein n=1 Tax=Hymenobacter properus TaxID=2791026 RepID=A0A931BIR9_9BACT|nr:DUF4249 domain-containing protein [Hymenobacter properus]MBF9143063.1 DUF4249 domain-containing protein [Hymenobacter properus]MBR7721871.1 DUF4249 domain-containing protein [Microvirga sp. SRT04]
MSSRLLRFLASACAALVWGGALLAGCTDAYLPEVISTPANQLVVDGFINAAGVSTIKLSRTYAISAAGAAPVETRAVVYIEDEGGARYPLTESSTKGTYNSLPLTLAPTRKYRLHLNLTSGKEYASDFEAAKLTPPIDAVTWNVNSNKLNIYVSAHDATNRTQYYRWDYNETWEIQSPYQPSVEYVPNRNVVRPIVNRLPTVCWGSARSTKMLLAKTTSLTQDVVANFPVRQLEPASAYLYTRYSILVQQQGLTKEEYEYSELLRKNTESIGSLYDAQPVQLTGNVRCLSNPTEVVQGFVGVHSISEKRIFIRSTDLPSSWPVVTGYENCTPPDTFYIDRHTCPCYPKPQVDLLLTRAFGAGTFLPIEPLIARDSLYGPIDSVQGYTARERDCIDCRTRGTAVRPSYW